MNQDDDVERLFSWLQTPDIRYREFAGAREVTDATVSYQLRTNTPEIETPAPHDVQLDEEYPADQFPDQSQVRVEVEPAGRPPAPIAPTPAPVVSAPMAPEVRPGEPFGLGVAGRGTPAAVAPPVAPPAPPPVTSPPIPVSTPETGGEGTARPLASVFNRLAGGRADPSDPRDRLRHIPGLGPGNGPSR
jgi:hypothetical protein